MPSITPYSSQCMIYIYYSDILFAFLLGCQGISNEYTRQLDSTVIEETNYLVQMNIESFTVIRESTSNHEEWNYHNKVKIRRVFVFLNNKLE